MGIDWFRFQLKSGVDGAHFRVLIEQQSQAFNECCFFYNRETSLFLNQPYEYVNNPEANERYQNVCLTMRDLIEIDERDEEVCSRVYPITHCHVLPLEWRIGAHRTYHPEDIPLALDRWRTLANRFLFGEFRAYLVNAYLFSEPVYYEVFWGDLLASARDVQQKTNAWAVRPDLKEVVARILAVPNLPSYPAPHWEEWQHHPDAPVNADVLSRYDRWLKQASDIFELIREWNHLVPTKWKLRRPHDHPYGVDDYLADIAPGSWFDQFLKWVDQCVENKVGLWLDY